MAENDTNSEKAIDQTIRKKLARLRKAGVLMVRPGYEIANHQLTGKAAIVATVHTKKAVLPKADLLPDKIGNTPVDVREAHGISAAPGARSRCGRVGASL